MALNWPNILTLGRIVLIVPICALMLTQGPAAAWACVALFVVSAVTDYFDGWLARRLNQLTPLGRMLDPIADKLLVGALLIMLAAEGRLPGVHVFAAVLIMLRELLVSGLREFLSLRAISLPVTKLAKWKTTVQLLAFPFLLLGPQHGPDWLPAMPIGWGLLWLSAVLTVWTGWGYVTATIAHATDKAR